MDMRGRTHDLDGSGTEGKYRASYFDASALVWHDTPARIGHCDEHGYALPSAFDGQIDQVAGMGTMFTVTLKNGEVWGMMAHLNQGTVCRELHLEEPGLVAQDGTRWCKWPRKSKRVIDLTADCLVEEGGDLKCPLTGERSKLHKLALPPVASFSEGATDCAILQTGEVACWGNGRYGQLGYIAPGTGVGDEPGQNTPPKTFLRFKTPVKKVIAADRTIALTEGGELWCWGDCGELPFADTGEPESYWNRMCADSPPKPGSPAKPVGSSTMPSAPLKLPEGCVPKDFAWSCVLCEDGCTKCWHDKESLEKAECITY